MVDKMVNNRQNWNTIDDVTISLSIASPIASRKTRKTKKRKNLITGPRAADDKS